MPDSSSQQDSAPRDDDTHQPATAISPQIQTNIATASTNQGTSSPARSTRNGWDGKLRITDINGTNDEDSNGTSDDESDQETQQQQETTNDINNIPRLPPSHPTQTNLQPHVIPHAAPMNQPGVRRAVLENAAPIEGDVIPQDEDVLNEFELDSEEIDLVHLRISDLPKLGLQRFTQLQRLCLRQNAIQDISSLPAELEDSLTELDLYDNLIKHIHGLERFLKLKILDLSFNKIKHVKRVNHLKELTDLYFVQNRISEIDGLEGLTKLRNLELGGNRIRSIEGLETLTGLEELWLGKNKITEIKGLDALSNLTILSIQSNRLTSLSGLSNLKNLQELHISHNQLTSLTGLQSNTSLKVIDISSNPIPHLTGLETLTNLEEFWASNCLFDSFEDVEGQLGDKESLETVYFEGNPLQKRQPVLYRNKVRLALPRIRQIDATYVQV